MTKTVDVVSPKALIIDDEVSICESLGGVLSDEGWQTVGAHSGLDGIAKFISHQPDLVFLDVWMPGMDGIETLQKLKELRDDIPVVIMSGHGTIETAVRATRLGAFEFLEKPLSIDKLIPMIEHARQLSMRKQKQDMAGENRYELIGRSSVIESIRRQIRIVAPRNAWVLITGENGTGKEVVARNLHLHSSRSSRPFVAVNCAAIPDALIESELFGHKKGAFTNALVTKRGKFELAHQGTLFLDEIGDMALRTQAKILRILQEQQFERLGDDETIDVDVRVIAATNKDLSAEIKSGNFREDLFYRLNVIPFHMPLLSERPEDIPLLADHFLQTMSRELGERKVFSPQALIALSEYPWPGNVRELRNMIERLCIMVPGEVIEEADLFPGAIDALPRSELQAANAAANLKQAKTDFERSFILDKLQENQWNVSKTADAIGIERSNLHRKLRTYRIDPKQLKG